VEDRGQLDHSVALTPATKNDKFSALNILHLYPDEELCQMLLKMSSLFGK
jgi:hypothetical protein